MITLAEWKLIGITIMAIFFISAIVYGITSEIVVKMKNKTKKHKRQQIICSKDIKMLNPANFISNYNEFVNENIKNMSLCEIKEFKKIVNQEILNMLLKGVR